MNTGTNEFGRKQIPELLLLLLQQQTLNLRALLNIILNRVDLTTIQPSDVAAGMLRTTVALDALSLALDQMEERGGRDD